MCYNQTYKDAIRIKFVKIREKYFFFTIRASMEWMITLNIGQIDIIEYWSYLYLFKEI